MEQFFVVVRFFRYWTPLYVIEGNDKINIAGRVQRFIEAEWNG